MSCTIIVRDAGPQEWIVSRRMNKADGGDDDPGMVKPRAMNEFHAATKLNTTDQRMVRCAADAILAADADNRRAPSEPPRAGWMRERAARKDASATSSRNPP